MKLPDSGAARVPKRPAQPRAVPFLGVAVVFLRQMRGRRAGYDLALVVVNLVGLLAISAALQSMWLTTRTEYTNEIAGFLMRWQITAMAAAALLIVPAAGMVGSLAAPPATEFEATQTALLTRLTPFDLITGRLLARLWVLVAAILASCAFWMAANLVIGFAPGSGHGFVPIVAAHVVLLAECMLLGGIGCLCALRRRPGRTWGRGAGAALATGVLFIGAIFLMNPVVGRVDNPKTMIEASLLVNPVSAVTTASGLDVLRTRLLYDRLDAHDYPFDYPPAFATAALYGLVAAGILILSAHRLRIAYR